MRPTHRSQRGLCGAGCRRQALPRLKTGRTPCCLQAKHPLGAHFLINTCLIPWQEELPEPGRPPPRMDIGFAEIEPVLGMATSTASRRGT